MKRAKLLSFISEAIGEEELRYTEGYSQPVSRMKPRQKMSDQVLSKEWILNLF
jgi:hypothetical protein